MNGGLVDLVLNMRNQNEDDAPDPQIVRLDNMLAAEGVSGDGKSPTGTSSPAAVASGVAGQPDNTIEHSDYKVIHSMHDDPSDGANY